MINNYIHKLGDDGYSYLIDLGYTDKEAMTMLFCANVGLQKKKAKLIESVSFFNEDTEVLYCSAGKYCMDSSSFGTFSVNGSVVTINGV